MKFLLALCSLAAHAAGPTVVLDASAFFDRMPKGTILTQAPSPGARSRSSLPDGAWLFNNNALIMRSQAYLHATAHIPEPGLYHLYVRSHGHPKSSFRVMLGEKQTTEIFGNAPLLWKSGGSFQLPKGPLNVVLSRVNLGGETGPLFDVLVLTQDPSFNEAALRPFELHPDVQLLKQYPIPRSSAVKFGDVDADAKSDFLVLTPNYDAHMFDHSGRELWSHKNDTADTRLRAEFEAPGLLWDFDGDGRAEAVHYRFNDGQESLVLADGRTGAVLHQVPWPTTALPHVYNNFRLAVARLSGDYPSHLLVFTDSGGTISITAFDRNLRQIWQHVEKRLKDHMGHYIYAADLNGDNIDEVIASPIVLDSKGNKVWDRFDLFDDNHDHADSFRFHDLDGDGKPELLAPFSEVGVVAFRPSNGAILWRQAAEHTQQLEIGNFLRGLPPPHIAVNARTYARNGEAGLGGQVFWFDAKGNLLSKWPANPLNGNPDFVKGDWKGDGKEELFWYKFRLTPDGKGILYFKRDVYHMFDFMGSGADQVIARGPSALLIYGYKNAPARPRNLSLAARKKIANHTHY